MPAIRNSQKRARSEPSVNNWLIIDEPPPPRARHATQVGLKSLVREWLIICISGLALMELGLRVMQVPAATNSMPTLFQQPLLPFLPNRPRFLLEGAELRLRKENLDVIDLGFLLAQANPRLDLSEFWIRKKGHISPPGNRLLALEIEKELAPWIERANRPLQ